MQGYSKIKGNNSFIQRSKSNKEFLFLDRDFDLLSSSKNTHKKTQLGNEPEPEASIHGVKSNNNKVDFFLGKSNSVVSFEEFDNEDENSLKNREGRDNGGVLRRNLSVSSASANNSSYKKKSKGNNNNDNNNQSNGGLERQSSTRAIQEAVKKAFSIRRSSSVNSDRYCRIYDQPILMSVDGDDDCDFVNHDDVNNHDDDDDYDVKRNGSFKTRSASMMQKNNPGHNHGRRHVASKVVRACKRLFSR